MDGTNEQFKMVCRI